MKVMFCREGQQHRPANAPSGIDTLQEKDIGAILDIICSNTSMPSIWGVRDLASPTVHHSRSNQHTQTVYSLLRNLRVLQQGGASSSKQLSCNRLGWHTHHTECAHNKKACCCLLALFWMICGSLCGHAMNDNIECRMLGLVIA